MRNFLTRIRAKGTTTRPEDYKVMVLSREEIAAVLETRSQELLGVSAEKAMFMADIGELPDDLPGRIVGSWVTMARGVEAHS